MCKLTLAFAILLLPIAVCAQSQANSFRVEVRHLTFVGATQISDAEQQQIANQIENLPFAIDSVAEISDRLRYALQERGFFKAAAAAPDVTIVSRSPSEQVIDVNYHVDLGQQYRLKEITFSNVDPRRAFAFGSSELRQTFPIDDGEIFDIGKIRIGLEKLRELYADHGYINFTPVPNTDADDAAATISLRVDMDEGIAFRVGSLLLEGVEPVPGAGATLLRIWKPYEGQIYNQEILEQFVRENAAYFPRDASTLSFRMHEDSERHIVNFVLELNGPIQTH